MTFWEWLAQGRNIQGIDERPYALQDPWSNVITVRVKLTPDALQALGLQNEEN
ncbi:hypothetical protein ACWCRF_07265 [Streptomyces sp. NPDC002405]